MQDQGYPGKRPAGAWDMVGQMRDKFEYDRERRMREKGKINVGWMAIFLRAFSLEAVRLVANQAHLLQSLCERLA